MIGGVAFSTSAFADYRTAINRTFVPLTADPAGDRPFRASLAPGGDDRLRITTVRASPHRVRRTPALIDAAPGEYVLATIQVSGRSAVEQDGREARLGPGDLVFCDSTRPFAFTFDEPFRQGVVQAPRAVVADRTLRRATAVPLKGSGPGAAAGAFFRALAPHDPGRLSAHGVAMLADVLVMAAGAEPAPGELDRRRVLDHLAAAFRDPRLDAAGVARACHLSRRALFRLFADAPLSLADEMRRVRVAEAQRLLRLHPARSVAEIAPACGFLSETQARRAFRAVTGTTPAAYRGESRA